MKIYVQQNGTGRLLKTAHQWVETMQDAREFNTSLEAFDYCHEYDLRDGFILLRAADPANSVLFSPFAEEPARPAL